MSENTKIEWCDHTFNPWIGCSKVSPGCDHCYAEQRMDTRLHRVAWGAGQPRQRTKTWGDPVKWNKRHAAFLAEHGRRQRVFCASLADVFDNEVDLEWRLDLMRLIDDTPNLDWLLLTKRIGNVMPMVGDFWGEKWPENIWLGATFVNQDELNRDITKLLAVPVRVKFLSLEPLLAPIDLSNIPHPHSPKGVKNLRLQALAENGAGVSIKWVIVGGESGPGARPMHPDWARSLRDQCKAANVPFLFKQWGEWAPYDRSRTDGEILAEKNSLDTPLQKFGKKAAGRLLDGRTWDEFPA